MYNKRHKIKLSVVAKELHVNTQLIIKNNKGVGLMREENVSVAYQFLEKLSALLNNKWRGHSLCHNRRGLNRCRRLADYENRAASDHGSE